MDLSENKLIKEACQKKTFVFEICRNNNVLWPLVSKILLRYITYYLSMLKMMQHIFSSFCVDVVVINICFAHLSSLRSSIFLAFLWGQKIITQSLSFQHLNTLKTVDQIFSKVSRPKNSSKVSQKI